MPIAILSALVAVAPIVATPVATHHRTPTRLIVDGAVARPLALDAAGFASLPHTGVRATIHGTVLTCTGVALTDVVASAGVATGEAVRGEAVRGEALALIVVARAADGYRVAFSLGEVDRTLGRAQIVVADRCNGAALPDGDGPWRLIAGGDVHGARSVRALERLSVVAVP